MYTGKPNKLSFEAGLTRLITHLVRIINTRIDIDLNLSNKSKKQIVEMLEESDRNHNDLDGSIHRKKTILIAISRLPRESMLELSFHFFANVLSLVKDIHYKNDFQLCANIYEILRNFLHDTDLDNHLPDTRLAFDVIAGYLGVEICLSDIGKAQKNSISILLNELNEIVKNSIWNEYRYCQYIRLAMCAYSKLGMEEDTKEMFKKFRDFFNRYSSTTVDSLEYYFKSELLLTLADVISITLNQVNHIDEFTVEIESFIESKFELISRIGDETGLITALCLNARTKIAFLKNDLKLAGQLIQETRSIFDAHEEAALNKIKFDFDSLQAEWFLQMALKDSDVSKYNYVKKACFLYRKLLHADEQTPFLANRPSVERKVREALELKQSIETSLQEPMPVVTIVEVGSQTSTEERLKALSDFSSEIDHSAVSPENRQLTVEEFESLPERGLINPFRLRTAQGGINPGFRDGQYTLKQTEDSLVNDPEYAKQIPPIHIGFHDGSVYSFDTRRLITHQKAKERNQNVFIRYEKIYGQDLQERVNKIFSSRPWKGFVTALRFGGVNSESTPYINPAVRPQLENKVSKDFFGYPNERKSGVDLNGFPIDRKKASKIFNFLENRSKAGSKQAKSKLKEVKSVYNSQGEEATYKFLIDLKSKGLNQHLDESMVDVPKNIDNDDIQIVYPKLNSSVEPEAQSTLPHNSSLYNFRYNKRESKISQTDMLNNDTRWYDDDEINTLLLHYLQDDQSTELLTALIGTNWQAGNTLKNQLVQFNQKRASEIRFGLPVADQVIIPVNLSNNHWVLVCIHYHQDLDVLPDVYYIDPLGGEVNSDVAFALQDSAVFPSVAILQQPGFILQHDDFNCGPWIIEIARHFSRVKNLPQPNSININMSRIQQQADLALIRSEELNMKRSEL